MSEILTPTSLVPTQRSSWASGVPLAVGLAALAVAGGAPSATVIALLYVAAVTPELVAADRQLHRLPNRLVLPGYPVAALAIGLSAAQGRGALVPLLAGAGYFVFLLVPAIAGGMGVGDVKLAGVLGLCLGTFGFGAALAGPVLAFLFGAVHALWAMLARRVDRAERIPFGPAMLMGFWTVVAAETLMSRLA